MSSVERRWIHALTVAALCLGGSFVSGCRVQARSNPPPPNHYAPQPGYGPGYAPGNPPGNPPAQKPVAPPLSTAKPHGPDGAVTKPVDPATQPAPAGARIRLDRRVTRAGTLRLGRRTPDADRRQAGERGRLIIQVVGGFCNLQIDGKGYGSGRSLDVLLPVGEHRVSCMPSAGGNQHQTLTVRASGRPASAIFDLSKSKPSAPTRR